MPRRKWHKAQLYLAPSKIEGVGCFSGNNSARLS